ncbi:MAG TPA: bacillithiol biosynthesis cysteine-adding enzyme BshC, partial [candidate division Zixibacteria bacterium]|nr:bacillithiol biosynthesis cysteine-adding enzyme BshC [candidate division Zixibacteria bacterium]
MDHVITPSKELGYSDIYLDFVKGSDRAKEFYPAGSLEEVASRLDLKEFPRNDMAGILERQNKLFGAGEKTLRNIALLRDKKTLCVFSGQQAGLFTGPMLVVIKALAIVKAATVYSEKLNRPVIPIFWIAADDHDIPEINHTCLLNRSSDVVKLTYDVTPAVESSVSQIHFDDAEKLETVKQELRDTLGETDFTAKLYALVDKAYTSSDTYVTAFGKVMAELTREYGLVFFSPGDTEAKRLAKGLFRDIINNQDLLHRYLDQTNASMKERGYHIQVEKKESAADLFFDLDGRKPILHEGDRFTVGEKSFSKEELLRLIEDHPEKFSPDALTRPLMQSYLFPTISQKGGAAEIAYLAQISKVFELFSLVNPLYKARPSLTIVEARYEKLMKEYGLEFEDLLGDIEQTVNRVLAASFPDDIEAKFSDLREDISARFSEFSSTSLEFDPSLKSFSEQIRGKIDYNLKAFEQKVFSSHKKKSQETRDRIYRVWRAL